MALVGGDESAVVRGVKELIWLVGAMVGFARLVLKTEEAVLVELAEPIPFSKSPGGVFDSSRAFALVTRGFLAPFTPFDVALSRCAGV